VSEFCGEPEYTNDEGPGGDELSLVDSYFPKEVSSPAESYPDDAPPERHVSPEQRLVNEYRESDFDAGEVQGWRQAVDDVAGGEYSADEYLSAYEDEPEDDYQYEGDAGASIDLGNGQAATPEEWAASMERQGITPEMLAEAWAAEHPNERLMQNWLHLDNLNGVLADREGRQAAEQNQQLAKAESEARGMVAAAFREAGAGRVDVDTGLRAAVTVAETQIAQWESAGYSQEQIAEMTGNGTFDRWCIATAAELGRQAQISDRALSMV
jgi:hypothetical protein